jgi:signal transduction histidine kinase/CheY-like chemotaxis protein
LSLDADNSKPILQHSEALVEPTDPCIEPPNGTPGELPVPLDAVITTAELARRSSRPPDYEVESRALAGLMNSMATATESGGADRILKQLVDTVLSVCRAHSAGVSILEAEGGKEVFRWRAAAGVWGKFVGGSMARDRSPCGTVLDRNTSILMSHPERHYRYSADAPPLAEVLLIPFHHEGKPVGTVWVIAHDETRKFDAEDHRLIASLSRSAATAYQLLLTQELKADLAAQKVRDEKLTNDLEQLRRTEAALRETQAWLEAELADSRTLQTISSELMHEENVDALYERIIEAIVSIMDSDFASLQMLETRGEGGKELKLLAFRGFHPEAVKLWDVINVESQTACGEALRTGQRVIIPDVENCEIFLGWKEIEAFRMTGISSVQTTPLFSRSGKLVGMFSSQWRKPHQPAERELRLLDILSRQAADLIENKRADEALREASRRKDEFLAMLAHELRNPLAPILSVAEVMRALPDGDPKVKWGAEVINRQARHMSRLVDDLLDVSRLTSGKIMLKKEVVDLATAVARAVETTHGSFARRRQELLVTLSSEPLRLHADPVRLSQVLENLLGNASKYSPEGGRIWLTTERDPAQAKVRVRDEGIGIPGNMLSRIFDLFTQVDPSIDRAQGGLGIGLTMVRSLVELHGGTVEALSEGHGKGSEFVVRLPLLADASRGGPERGTAPSNPYSKVRRILIVDDNEDAARSLALLLELRGHRVTTVHEPEQVVKVAAADRPDIVFLDIGLPRINGYEIAKRLRAQPGLERLILVAVSGYADEEHRRLANEAGFHGRVVKPVSSSVLQELMDRLL